MVKLTEPSKSSSRKEILIKAAVLATFVYYGIQLVASVVLALSNGASFSKNFGGLTDVFTPLLFFWVAYSTHSIFNNVWQTRFEAVLVTIGTAFMWDRVGLLIGLVTRGDISRFAHNTISALITALALWIVLRKLRQLDAW